MGTNMRKADIYENYALEPHSSSDTYSDVSIHRLQLWRLVLMRFIAPLGWLFIAICTMVL